MKQVRLIFFFILLGASVSACSKTGTLTVWDPWVRPAALGGNGAVYLIISNATDTDDTVLSASTDAASTAEVHMSMIDGNDVISMKMQEVVPIPAQQEVIFKPGGLHLMLIGLTRDLKTGDTISLTLHFKEAGNITLEVPVEEQ